MANPVVALAGASGDVGFRIARALIDRGADVRALVCPDVSAAERTRLEAIGLHVTEAHPLDRDALAAACAGSTCVGSALNGVHEVMIDRQGVLLDATVQADVPRSSRRPTRSTHTDTPRQNRNFDLRREFMARADKTPIKVTSILNGAFLDMLGAEMPIIQRRIRRVRLLARRRSATQLHQQGSRGRLYGRRGAGRHDAANPAHRRR